ncbi:MAG TPA: alpha/beta hydrolase, partial [Nocardioidaceae bacterium]|nr:alpha/beta hydrolase [Nocardioidaceae bacterium]
GARSAAPSSAATQPFLRRRFVANHPGSLSAITLLLVTAADRVDELAALGVPVHVVYGKDDDGWPIDVQREMARRLAVTPHVVPGTAHSPAAEDPQATAALLTRLLTAPPTAAAVPGQHCPADRPG